jgi:hypothetical protein
MNERQRQIQMMIRLNEGRLRAPAFLSKLSLAIGQNLSTKDLLPLEETDSLSKVLTTGYRRTKHHDVPGYSKFFSPQQAAHFFRLVDCLAQKISGRVFLLTMETEYCGAVELEASVVFSHAHSLLRLDAGTSVNALSSDRSQAVMLDSNLGDPVAPYEVVVWGEHWPLLVMECVSNLSPKI